MLDLIVLVFHYKLEVGMSFISMLLPFYVALNPSVMSKFNLERY